MLAMILLRFSAVMRVTMSVSSDDLALDSARQNLLSGRVIQRGEETSGKEDAMLLLCKDNSPAGHGGKVPGQWIVCWNKKMKHSVRSHCAGSDAIPDHIQTEIAGAIDAVSIKPAKGAATKIRDAILAGLKTAGWSGKFPVAKGSDMTITSIRDGIGLCLQTGNMARMYADIIKLQALYLDNSIKAAVLIVPSEPVALTLGSNIAQAKRLERELEIFRKAYHVPTLVFALE